MNDLIQVLYALNETYFFSEKQFMHDFDSFTIRPIHFITNINQIISSIGNSSQQLIESCNKTDKMINLFIDLAQPLYKPKYSRNLDKEK